MYISDTWSSAVFTWGRWCGLQRRVHCVQHLTSHAPLSDQLCWHLRGSSCRCPSPSLAITLSNIRNTHQVHKSSSRESVCCSRWFCVQIMYLCVLCDVSIFFWMIIYVYVFILNTFMVFRRVLNTGIKILYARAMNIYHFYSHGYEWFNNIFLTYSTSMKTF